MKALNEKIIYCLIFLGILSFLSLEFIFKLDPCFLCILQRIPYYLAAIICLLHASKIIKTKYFLILIALCFIVAFFISIFHILVEEGIFQFSCNAITADTLADLKFQMQNIKPDCSDKAYIFGLRITHLSSILNITILVFLLHINKKNPFKK